MADTSSDQNISKSAKRRLGYKLAGLCTGCGKTPSRDGKTKCESCANKIKTFCATKYTGKFEYLAWRKQYKNRLKQDVFTAYGWTKCSCPKCPEMNVRFLTIDHINNDGAKHRKELNIRTSSQLHLWLIRNNYPDGFQALCWNCNSGRHLNSGVCPHME